MSRIDVFGIDQKIKEKFASRLKKFSEKEKELERVELIYFNSRNKEDVTRAKEKAFLLRKELSQDNTLLQMQEYEEMSSPLLKRYREEMGKVRKISFFGKTQAQDSNNDLISKEFLLLAKNYIEVDDACLRISKCQTCGTPSSECIETEDEILCPGCGQIFPATEDACPYKDSQRNSAPSKTAYATKPQFLEVIEKFQAKKNTKIPDSVKELIKSELLKYGIKPEEAKKRHIYMVLLDNNLTDYHEELSLLLWELNGTLPPDISMYHEKLSNCYDTYEKVYLHMIKEKDRRKSLNAWYLLFKLLQHVGYSPNVDDFCFLKNTTKTKDCDEKFSKVCKILGWDFQYTI
ncbi:transcription factor A2-like protein [Golden Marseillevirus]|uniref:transcription factor A2-like protein n=1 Tax=Golden Marseillevirus TaxID=1720526 RepID=UPI000877AB1C|nr:transcription factor A2-like protein [Golden Marseillevirus]ALX27596.1 transcription factor A2-like protein [Golden Marseillevirus]